MFIYSFFFFNDTATTEIYTLSLHDALPISIAAFMSRNRSQLCVEGESDPSATFTPARSEEHTSELQSRQYLVCRLLLEKKTRTFYTSWLPDDLVFTLRSSAAGRCSEALN